jgi:hypothetical protein
MRAISVSIWARNSSALAGVTSPFSRLLEQGLGLDFGEVGRRGGRMAVVAGGGPGLDEGRPAQAVAFEIALPGGDVLAADLAEPLEGAAEALVLEVDDRVGAVGGDHMAAPAAVADGLVVLEPILRALGGGQGLDVEAVEQRPGPEGLGGQGLVDGVEIEVRGRLAQEHLQAEHLAEHVVEPQPGRRAAKQVEVAGQQRQASRGSVSGTPALERTFRASRPMPWL